MAVVSDMLALLLFHAVTASTGLDCSSIPNSIPSPTTCSCFAHYTDTQSWWNARSKCDLNAPDGFEGHLAWANDQTTYSLLRSLSTAKSRIGLKTKQSSHRSPMVTSEWAWYRENEPPVELTFVPSEGESVDTSYHLCITIDTNGKYEDDDCGVEFQYFCEFVLDPKPTTCVSSTPVIHQQVTAAVTSHSTAAILLKTSSTGSTSSTTTTKQISDAFSTLSNTKSTDFVQSTKLVTTTHTVTIAKSTTLSPTPTMQLTTSSAEITFTTSSTIMSSIFNPTTIMELTTTSPEITSTTSITTVSTSTTISPISTAELLTTSSKITYTPSSTKIFAKYSASASTIELTTTSPKITSITSSTIVSTSFSVPATTITTTLPPEISVSTSSTIISAKYSASASTMESTVTSPAEITSTTSSTIVSTTFSEAALTITTTSPEISVSTSSTIISAKYSASASTIKLTITSPKITSTTSSTIVSTTFSEAASTLTTTLPPEISVSTSSTTMSETFSPMSPTELSTSCSETNCTTSTSLNGSATVESTTCTTGITSTTFSTMAPTAFSSISTGEMPITSSEITSANTSSNYFFLTITPTTVSAAPSALELPTTSHKITSITSSTTSAKEEVTIVLTSTETTVITSIDAETTETSLVTFPNAATMHPSTSFVSSASAISTSLITESQTKTAKLALSTIHAATNITDTGSNVSPVTSSSLSTTAHIATANETKKTTASERNIMLVNKTTPYHEDNHHRTDNMPSTDLSASHSSPFNTTTTITATVSFATKPPTLAYTMAEKKPSISSSLNVVISTQTASSPETPTIGQLGTSSYAATRKTRWAASSYTAVTTKPKHNYMHVQPLANNTIAISSTKMPKTGSVTVAKQAVQKDFVKVLQYAGIDNSTLNDLIATRTSIQESLPFMLQLLGEDTMKQIGHHLLETVPLCTYNDEDCDYDRDFKQVYDPSLGNCWTYNFNTTTPHMTYRAGSKYGLTILLQGSQSEYICSSLSAGFRVVIHNAMEHPFPDTMGYLIPPGTYSSLAIKQNVIKRLPSPYGSCRTSEDLTEYYYNGTFTVEGCMRSCFQNSLIKKCGCGDPRFPMHCDTIDPFCTLEQKTCMDFHHLCHLDRRGSKDCMCNNPCTEIIFDAVLTSAKLKQLKILDNTCRNTEGTAKEIFGCISEARKNFALINIYYEKLNSIGYTETKAYTLYQLASDIGGVTGCVLGPSAITLIEFGYSVIGIMVYVCTKGRHSLMT